MTSTIKHEATVASRFDDLQARFKTHVPETDARLSAILAALGLLQGRRVLDLGCGKGRFSSRLRERGAVVVGVDLSPKMLRAANGLDRALASARALPFANSSFDAVIAVEMFEHVADRELDAVISEAARVLRPKGTFAVVDKNLWSMNAVRPWLPNLAVKWIDERRGYWMYPPDGPVRERWFRPGSLQKRLALCFKEVRVEMPLTRAEESCLLFRRVPAARLFALWAARMPRMPQGGTAS